MIMREIPSTGALLPVIGLGTWQTFDRPPEGPLDDLREVLELMQTGGARLIDSSPMYGKAEEVIGRLAGQVRHPQHYFYATKVWTRGREEGIRQMEDSMHKMERPFIDLIQVHNLLDWRIHLETIEQWKKEGRIRYSGITHYTDDMHPELEQIVRSVRPDFVQFNYSIVNRNAEKRLLQACMDSGVAVIVNRPFGEGRLFARVKGQSLPDWCLAAGIRSWSQFFLKYIIAHPAVTCVIPATANPEHMKDNLDAGTGLLPDAALRKKMADFMETI